ncbi:MAG: glycosyltransferase [Planctomycetota bacterium]
MDKSPTKKLTWGLAIATYERRDDLKSCIRLALNQSRMPAEVVVVDASADFEGNKAAIEEVVADRVPLTYEKARRPSASLQRNHCVELSTADVLFLIDDDSLLWPETAERVMQIYESDPDELVAGCATLLADRPPTPEDSPEPPSDSVDDREYVNSYGVRHGGLAQNVRRWLKADDLFVPYDADWPDHDLPDQLKALPIGWRQLMAGMHMTARRSVLLKEPFAEDLLDRGGEDSDVSYRISRHGILVTRLDAYIHHVGSPAGRVTNLSREQLYAVVPLMMHRKHSTNRELSAKRQRAFLFRKAVLGFVKDLRFSQFALPHFRGALAGLKAIKPLLGKALSDDEAARWFENYQKSVIRMKA